MRPSDYDSKVKPHLSEIAKMRNHGMTEEQIANQLGVHYRTFNRYKVKYDELSQVLKKTKQDLVYELEDSLFTKAKGFFTTKKIVRKYVEDADGNRTGLTEVTETITEHAPDVGGLAFSLKNLAPDKWKEKVEHNIDGGEEVSKAAAKFLGVK